MVDELKEEEGDGNYSSHVIKLLDKKKKRERTSDRRDTSLNSYSLELGDFRD